MKLTRIAILGVVLALSAAGCSDEGNVFSLGEGDCFRSVTETEFADVPIVDCSEPHEHQVYALWNVVGDSLPSQTAMDEGCFDRFETAIGTSYADSEIYGASLVPTQGSFEAGDREVICYTFELDDAGEAVAVTGSVLGSNR